MSFEATCINPERDGSANLQLLRARIISRCAYHRVFIATAGGTTKTPQAEKTLLKHL